MVAALNVRDRLSAECPSWRAECQPDGVSEAVNHWSAAHQLPGDDVEAVAYIEAYARQEQPGQPAPEPVLVITSLSGHFRSSDQTRAFAEGILARIHRGFCCRAW